MGISNVRVKKRKACYVTTMLLRLGLDFRVLLWYAGRLKGIISTHKISIKLEAMTRGAAE